MFGPNILCATYIVEMFLSWDWFARGSGGGCIVDSKAVSSSGEQLMYTTRNIGRLSPAPDQNSAASAHRNPVVLHSHSYSVPRCSVWSWADGG